MNKKIEKRISRFRLKNFGKVFLLVGIIFAITEITNANAQSIPVSITLKCNKWVNGDCAVWGSDYCHQYQSICTDYAISSASVNFADINRYISHPTQSIPSASQTLANMSNAEFKNKIISSIPDKDAQFKAKIMTVLPLSELAEMYDPNKIYQ